MLQWAAAAHCAMCDVRRGFPILFGITLPAAVGRRSDFLIRSYFTATCGLNIQLSTPIDILSFLIIDFRQKNHSESDNILYIILMVH